jgi:ankyrin repeat protein
MLLQHGADLNNSEPYTTYRDLPIPGCLSPLGVALEYGDKDLFEYLVSKGANPKATCSRGPTLLFGLSYDRPNFNEVFDALIKAGVDINARDQYGRTALYYAVRRDNPALVKALLSHGASVNVKDDLGLSPLDFLRYRECKDILLAAGAKPGNKF